MVDFVVRYPTAQQSNADNNFKRGISTSYRGVELEQLIIERD